MLYEIIWNALRVSAAVALCLPASCVALAVATVALSEKSKPVAPLRQKYVVWCPVLCMSFQANMFLSGRNMRMKEIIREGLAALIEGVNQIYIL